MRLGGRCWRRSPRALTVVARDSLLDCDAGVIAYYLRGSSLGMAFQFDMPPGGLRAAVSTSTSISVNFGAKPLAFDIYGYTVSGGRCVLVVVVVGSRSRSVRSRNNTLTLVIIAHSH